MGSSYILSEFHYSAGFKENCTCVCVRVTLMGYLCISRTHLRVHNTHLRFVDTLRISSGCILSDDQLSVDPRAIFYLIQHYHSRNTISDSVNIPAYVKAIFLRMSPKIINHGGLHTLGSLR